MATMKKISNCGQTIPSFVLFSAISSRISTCRMSFHTTALAKVTLNRAHTTGWPPAKFGISPY
jgi:hypothetical protein